MELHFKAFSLYYTSLNNTEEKRERGVYITQTMRILHYQLLKSRQLAMVYLYRSLHLFALDRTRRRGYQRRITSLPYFVYISILVCSVLCAILLCALVRLVVYTVAGGGNGQGRKGFRIKSPASESSSLLYCVDVAGAG